MRHFLSILICATALAQPPIPPTVDVPEGGEVDMVPVVFAWDEAEPGLSYQLRWGQNSSAQTTNLSTTIWLPLGETNAVYVVSLNAAQVASVPSNVVEAHPHYVPWIVVGTELTQSGSFMGPWTQTGTNRIAITNTPPGVQQYWSSRATITRGRDLYYE